MTCRRFGVYATAAMIVACTLSVAAQRAPSSSPPPPATGTFQTQWGEPDLQGIWSVGTLTPMERPVRWADRPVLTPEEAAAYADAVANRPGGTYGRDQAPRPGNPGAYNEIFSEWGGDTAQQLDRGRTSLIVDPSDGRRPPYSPEGIKRENAFREWQRMVQGGVDPRVNDPPPNGLYNVAQMGTGASDIESRGTQERCFGEPMPYDPSLATFVRIVQSPGVVVLYLDRHQGRGDVRTINIGRGHLPSHIRLLHGDSIGWWEGDTLVVDTTNLTNRMEYFGARENLHLVERFTRVADGRIIWRVTLDDATTWTRPWTFEVGWTRRPDKDNQIYEQSCHEGNYGIIGLLAGRRHQERLYAEGEAPNNPDLLNREGRGPAPIPPDGRLPPNVGSSVPNPDSIAPRE